MKTIAESIGLKGNPGGAPTTWNAGQIAAWDLPSGSEFELRAGRAAKTGRPGSDRRAFAERGEIRRGVPVVRYL